METIGFGVEASEILRLLLQVSIALVGAAGLWGTAFWWRARHANAGSVWGALLGKMRVFLFAGIALFVAVLLAQNFAPPLLYAHEGINIAPTLQHSYVMWRTAQLFALLLAALVILYLWRIQKRAITGRLEGGLWAGFFVIATLMMVAMSDTIFMFLHSWHSILTLATVILVDYLFFVCHKSARFKRVLYPFFPLMSLAIWAGLAIDFIASFFILSDALVFTQKFFFTQTIIGIIIINGVFISGPVIRMLRSLVRPDTILPIPKAWRAWVGLSGSLSVVSWLTITTLDFTRGLTLGYMPLVLLFAGAVAVVYAIQARLEREPARAEID